MNEGRGKEIEGREGDCEKRAGRKEIDVGEGRNEIEGSEEGKRLREGRGEDNNSVECPPVHTSQTRIRPLLRPVARIKSWALRNCLVFRFTQPGFVRAEIQRE